MFISKKISIIVTSYTDENFKDICDLLDSINSQTYGLTETIYIVERCLSLSKKINEYIKKIGLKNAKVLLSEKQLGLSGARNLGLTYATGQILAFVDDDALLFPDWAEKLEKTYDDPSIGAVSGPAIPLWENPNMSWFPKELYWLVSCTGWCNWTKITDMRNIWGHNMSITREVFDDCGFLVENTGFSLSTGNLGSIGEDLAYSMIIKEKTKKRIVYDPNVKVLHKVYKNRLNVKILMRRAFWIGHSRLTLSRAYGKTQKNGRDLLQTENNVLDEIITALLPQIFKDFFRNPVIAFRKTAVTSITLIFVFAGYLDLRTAF